MAPYVLISTQSRQQSIKSLRADGVEVADIDQDARTVDHFELYQGIAVLGPCGPQDGGLCVLKGSHLKHQEYFDAIGGFRSEGDLGVGQNGYNYKSDDIEWYRNHGCEEIKICADPGDLIRKSCQIAFVDKADFSIGRNTNANP